MWDSLFDQLMVFGHAHEHQLSLGDLCMAAKVKAKTWSLWAERLWTSSTITVVMCSLCCAVLELPSRDCFISATTASVQ